MLPTTLLRTGALALCCVFGACSDGRGDKSAVEPMPDAGSPPGPISDAAPVLGDGATCMLPPRCKQISTRAFIFDVCCTAKVDCGLDTTPFLVSGAFDDPALQEVKDTLLPEDFDPAQPCVTFQSMIREWHPGLPAERVRGERGGDILITPECHSRSFYGRPLFGCCLPSGACGLSTHLQAPDFQALSNPGAEAKVAECTTPAEINRQLQSTSIALMAQIPDSHGNCDYAGLAARLPPLPPEE